MIDNKDNNLNTDDVKKVETDQITESNAVQSNAQNDDKSVAGKIAAPFVKAGAWCKGLFNRTVSRHDQKKKMHDASFISRADEKKIARENRRAIKVLEKQGKSLSPDNPNYITKMRNSENCVEFDNLHTYFFTDVGTSKAVDGVTFDVPMGKTVGIVGESGCGKSVTSLSLMKLLQRPQGQIVSGQIRFNGEDKVYDIVRTPTDDMYRIRGSQIAMIFQEPMTALNPVFRVGSQIEEVFEIHNKDMSKEQRKSSTIELLKMVGIANAEGVYRMYPHELSGGMRQRICIAMALACSPRLIIADEPTTALDVTIQAQILDLLRGIKDKMHSSIMLITHDLGVIAEMADYVVVMYSGKVVEKGTAHDIFTEPMHPYTLGLMRSKPVVGKKVDSLYNIPGSVPNPINMPDYCYFKDRCDMTCADCDGEYPPMYRVSKTHYVSCYRYKDKAIDTIIDEPVKPDGDDEELSDVMSAIKGRA